MIFVLLNSLMIDKQLTCFCMFFLFNDTFHFNVKDILNQNMTIFISLYLIYWYIYISGVTTLTVKVEDKVVAVRGTDVKVPCSFDPPGDLAEII